MIQLILCVHSTNGFELIKSQLSEFRIRNIDTGEVFLSIMDAARSCCANYGNNIGKCLRGQRPTAFGLKSSAFVGMSIRIS